VVKRRHQKQSAAQLNDTSDQWPLQFTINYTEDEQRLFRKIMAARHARMNNEGTVFGIMVGGILVLGLAALGAFKLGWIGSAAIRPVLFTAYFAFVAGAGCYYFPMRHYFRRFFREDARAKWAFLFDDAGIAYNSETMDVRMKWRALEGVEDWGGMILLLFNGRGIGIPSRIFSDDTARVDFVAAASARVKAAGAGTIK
jgi:hypothetical protein